MAGGAVKRTRFAPSPSGLLHLGHAHAAWVAAKRADPGQFLLRIEDLDRARCKPEFEAGLIEDLHWLGLDWPEPVLRQSERGAIYAAALRRLIARGLIYPCTCTRGQIRAAAAPNEGEPLSGPDGVVYPGTCRGRALPEDWTAATLRLDMAAALEMLAELPEFVETGAQYAGRHRLDPERLRDGVGDVILWRGGAAYHLAVVVDDADQGVTEVTRGEDLFEATQIHVLLQALLEVSTPSYHHHGLIRDDNGKRLAKRDDARAIRAYREAGMSVADVLALIDDSGL